jgi:hypothetical protein
MEARSADRMDRAEFAGFSRGNPHAERLADRVEQTLAAARQQNMNPTRTAIYYLLLGQEVDQKRGGQVRQQQRAGARHVAAQTTQPGTPRSTVAAPRRRPAEDGMEAVEARLRNVTIGDYLGNERDL